MAKLVLNPHSPSRRDVPLPRSILSIGRDPSNDLVLPDAMVSRRHALIEYRGSQFFLRDCNSSNGSLVNGDRVTERSLRDGDLVAIGSARLLFREEAEAVDPAGKVVQHPSAPRLQCPSCQADYRKGDAFCKQCGGRLQEGPARTVCPSCGSAVSLPARFCNACGGGLQREDGPAAASAEPAPAAPQPPANEPPAAAGDEKPLPELPLEPVAQAAPADGPREDEAKGERPAPVERASLSSGTPEAPQASRAALATARPAPAPLHATPQPEPRREAHRPLPVERARVVPISARSGERRTGQVAVRPPAAELGPRFLATLVDGLATSLLQVLVLSPAWFLVGWDLATTGALVAWAVSVLLALLVGLAYPALFWGLSGATPGQRLMGLEVVALDGTRPPGLGRGLLRAFGFALSAGALGLGFLPLLGGAPALHDRLAGTRVVRSG